MSGGIEDKFSQSVGMSTDYLQETGNTRLINTIQNQDVSVFSEDMPEKTLGYQENNSIFMNKQVLERESPEKVASIFLHELNHLSKQTPESSIQEEKECRTLEEQFLDSKGQGMYDDENQDQTIDETIRNSYQELPETN